MGATTNERDCDDARPSELRGRSMPGDIERRREVHPRTEMERDDLEREMRWVWGGAAT